MKIDVPTFQAFCLITTLCGALVTTTLSRMFPQARAFRFWASGFFLLTTASACFSLHSIWRNDFLVVATATLAFQSRILIWSGTRELFGAPAWWRSGLAVTALFLVLFSCALALGAPMLVRVLLLALFFAPCRAATLFEVVRRQRPHLGPARLMIALGSGITMLNAIVPLVMVLLDRGNVSLLLGNPRSTSAFYAVVFAGDLLLTCGLIALAFKLLSVERDMLATLDRGALEWLAQSRAMRESRGESRELPGSLEALEALELHSDAPGSERRATRQSLPGMI